MLGKHSVSGSYFVCYTSLVGESLAQLRNTMDENQLFGGFKIPCFGL